MTNNSDDIQMAYQQTKKSLWFADCAEGKCTIGSGDYVLASGVPVDIARLIAVAPELLAALRALLPYAENEAYSLQSLADSDIAETESEKAWQLIENALAIIDKAEGN